MGVDDALLIPSSMVHQCVAAPVTEADAGECWLENGEVDISKEDSIISRNSASSGRRNPLLPIGENGWKNLFVALFSEGQAEEFSQTLWLLAIFLGQLLSVILCISAVTSVYLVDVYNLHISNAQNFTFYITLSAIFTSVLAWRPGEANLFSVLKSRGWKYALVAFADAEGNYLVVTAYQYTTLTSVQLLDCFTIPTVLFLSWSLLRIRYRPVHIAGVFICLLGVGCLVWSDIENGIPVGLGKQRLLGDILCLSGAFLYGVSNVAQEFLVKAFDIVEFLGMVGLFGSVVTGVQSIILESDQITEGFIAGSPMPIILLIVFVFAQLSFYIVAGVLMKMSGATIYNLSILTADFYSLVVGIFVFQYKTLYFASFSLVIFGVIVFSLKPTLVPPQTEN